MKYSRKLLRQVQKQIARSSLVADQPFFPRAQFPWAKQLEDNWQIIREELEVVLARREDLPNFQDISPDQKHLAKEDKWKTFFFAYGLEVPSNCARCPRTAKLLQAVRAVRALRSLQGVIRYHLGLIVRIRVAETIVHWEEGRSILFDGTFEHEVWNDTDAVRVVLFMDVLRAAAFSDVAPESLDHQSDRGFPVHSRREEESRGVGRAHDRAVALMERRHSCRLPLQRRCGSGQGMIRCRCWDPGH